MDTPQIPPSADVVIIGAGHNGLVSAILLARAGLSVVVLEAAGVIGGATRTEHPFPKVPELGQSTGSYLLGLMPPELLRTLDLTIPVLRRDPHYFLPTPDGRYLLFGRDRAATREQMTRFFSAADAAADDAMQAELAALREDVGPAWLAPSPMRRPGPARRSSPAPRSPRCSSTAGRPAGCVPGTAGRSRRRSSSAPATRSA